MGARINPSEVIGSRFGLLSIICIHGRRRGNGDILYHAVCDCGRHSIVPAHHLRSKNTNSCGAGFHKAGKVPRRLITHGQSSRRGVGVTAEYRAWTGMKARCLNPNEQKYKDYGGRGIIICERWLDGFANFFGDMGRRPPGTSLGRLDNDGPYSPENCAWQTPTEQARNTRRNMNLTFRGETKTLIGWSEVTGIGESTIAHRLSGGWTIEEALTSRVRLLLLRA